MSEAKTFVAVGPSEVGFSTPLGAQFTRGVHAHGSMVGVQGVSINEGQAQTISNGIGVLGTGGVGVQGNAGYADGVGVQGNANLSGRVGVQGTADSPGGVGVQGSG